jgi:hypothetical protein
VYNGAGGCRTGLVGNNAEWEGSELCRRPERVTGGRDRVASQIRDAINSPRFVWLPACAQVSGRTGDSDGGDRLAAQCMRENCVRARRMNGAPNGGFVCWGCAGPSVTPWRAPLAPSHLIADAQCLTLQGCTALQAVRACALVLHMAGKTPHNMHIAGTAIAVSTMDERRPQIGAAYGTGSLAAQTTECTCNAAAQLLRPEVGQLWAFASNPHDVDARAFQQRPHDSPRNDT